MLAKVFVVHLVMSVEFACCCEFQVMNHWLLWMNVYTCGGCSVVLVKLEPKPCSHVESYKVADIGTCRDRGVLLVLCVVRSRG